MPSTLTSGFDFSVQLSKEFVQKIFDVAYYSGALPNYIKQPLLKGGTEFMELYFQPPALGLKNEGNDIVASIRFPFLMRKDKLDHELEGSMHMTVPVLLEKGTDEDGNAVQTFVISLKNIPADDVSLTFKDENPGTLLMSGLMKAVIMDYFATIDVRIPFSPSVSGVNLSVAVRAFSDPTFQPPSFSSYINPNFLGLFINVFSGATDVPKEVAGHLIVQPPFGNSNGFKDEVVTAIPADFFMGALTTGLAAAGLGTFPAKSPKDDTITFNSLNFELGTGHIKVSGNVTKEIDGLPDPSGDFTAKMLIGIFGGQVKVELYNITVDLPWWAEALPFLLPFIGSVIEGCIQRALEDKSSMKFSVPLPKFSFFLGKIKVSTTPVEDETAIVVSNEGYLAIDPTGVLMRSQISLKYPQVPITRPEYIIGHKGSKEFHVKGCYYGDMITHNAVLFIRPDVALKAGYNGCAFCQPEYDKMESGKMSFHFHLPHQVANQHMTKTVKYTMKLNKAMGVKGSTAAQEALHDMDNFTGDEGEYLQYFQFTDLMPGIWELDVSCDGWSTKVFKRVYSDRNRNLRFTFGEQGCKKA